jgi:2-haloacid dehalogenase
MRSPIKTIIFDFGGVLLEWDPRHLYKRYFPGQTQAMDQFLDEISFYQWNAQQDQGRSFSEAIATHSEKFPHYASLIQAYYNHWEDSITGAIPGTVDILHRLKQKGYPLYGLSNWSAETFPRARYKYPFFDLFDEIILSGDVKLIKPDPAIFALLLSKIRYTAPECLLIDDSLPNIETANKLGFANIHYTSPDQLQFELQKLYLL